MKAFLVIAGLLVLTSRLATAANPHGADIEDNDFAEFEDFDDEGKVHGFVQRNLQLVGPWEIWMKFFISNPQARFFWLKYLLWNCS